MCWGHLLELRSHEAFEVELFSFTPFLWYDPNVLFPFLNRLIYSWLLSVLIVPEHIIELKMIQVFSCLDLEEHIETFCWYVWHQTLLLLVLCNFSELFCQSMR